MEEFLKFYNENNKKKINVIYDDKRTRRGKGICGDYESPDKSTHCMYCEVINDKGELEEVGGLAEFDIIKGKYIDLIAICSNKYPSDSDYTHNGAATILLNILKKYVDFEKTKYPSFYLVLLSHSDSKEYYLRQNLQTYDNRYFSYGEITKTLRNILSPTEKELLKLRGDDDGTLPTDFFKKKRKSRRLNPKKKYDYTLTLLIDEKNYETSESSSVETSDNDDITDGNSLFECILL